MAHLLDDPRAIYSASKEIDGHPGDGGFLLAALRVIKFNAWWRRQTLYEPALTFDDLKEVNLLANSLDELGVPQATWPAAMVAFRYFESAGEAPKGRLQLPQDGDPFRGVHAVALVPGFDEHGETLQFANSWGARWGDGGSGWLTRAYAEAYMHEGWVVRDVRFGLTPFNWTQYCEAPDRKARRAAWMCANPRWQSRLEIPRRRLRAVLYEAVSMLGGRIEVIDLRTPNGFLVAWAFTHFGGTGVAVVNELFVWPEFRRQGIGTCLDFLIAYRAQLAGCTRVEIPVHEVDGTCLAARGAARRFASVAGYEWLWRRGDRPRTTALAVRDMAA